MRKHFKRNLSIFLTIIFLLSVFTMNSVAINADKIVAENNIVVNEWEEYSRVVSMTDKELSEAGYNKEDILKIRNFDFETEIRNRAKLDDETLRVYGYTDEEIKELRVVAAMNEIPESVMKTISTSTMTTKLKYKSNGSRTEAGKPMYYVNFEFSWKWNKIPFFRLIDMVAITFASRGTEEFNYCAKTTQKVKADLTALSSLYSDYSQEESWDYSTEKANNISVDFALGVTDADGVLTHFAYEGKGTFQLTNRSNEQRLYIDACYGHTTINIVPDFSIDLSGVNPIIKLRAGMDEQHCTGIFYEDFTIGDSYIYHGTIIGKK